MANGDSHRSLRHALFLCVVTLFSLYVSNGPVSGFTLQCDDIETCNPSVSCGTTCWNDLWETTCGDAGGFAAGYCESECGDGYCASGENWSTCSDDCGGPPPSPTCGANGCEPGETNIGCPTDCSPPSGGDYCGDGECSGSETGANCSEDCTFSGDSCEYPPGPYCVSGWECVENYCVWETDPVYKCCSAGCGGPGMCAVGEACGTVPNYNGLVCKPAWPD